MAKKKTLTNNQLFSAIALIVIGVLFCCFRAGMLNVLFTVIGAVLIALGAYDLFRKNWVMGAIELALGIAIIVCGWTVLEITLLVLGVVFIVYGVYLLVVTASKTKSFKNFNAWLAIIKPLLIILFGIFLVVAKWVLADWIFIVIGVIAIIDGVLAIIGK